MKQSVSSDSGQDETSPAVSRRAWIRRRILRIGRGAVVCYLGVLLMLLFLENKLLYFPSRYPAGNWNPAFAYEDAWFEAADGTQLHGWYLSHPDPNAVVLFAHGNAGNLTDRTAVVRNLQQKFGVSVMIFDYRGYGRSEGRPSEAGILQDARAARRWLAERAAVREDEIVLMGRSLGGGVMVDLAASDGAGALVLECTFSSLPEVAARFYPWLPVRRVMRNRFESESKIARYQGPLLQAHGSHDDLIELDIGRRLFDAANEPKQFVTIPRAGHNDMFLGTPQYDAALAALFSRCREGRQKVLDPQTHKYP